MRLFKVFTNPGKVFDEVKKERISVTIFNYAFGIFVLTSLLAIGVFLSKGVIIKAFVYYVLLFTFSLLLPALSLILSALIYLFSGEYSLEKGLKTVIYSFAPFYLLGWCIFLSKFCSSVFYSIIFTWTFILTVIGIEKIFGIGRYESAVCTTVFYHIIMIVVLISFLSV